MASTLTLDDIRSAAEAKYANLTLDIDGNEVVLRNALRLSKEERKALTDAVDVKDGDEGTDLIEIFTNAFRAVASNKGAELIAEAFGEDATLYVHLFEVYGKATELGEASDSQE